MSQRQQSLTGLDYHDVDAFLGQVLEKFKYGDISEAVALGRLTALIAHGSTSTFGPVNSRPLNSIEWHDLPVKKLSITERGIEVQVMPFNENTQEYDSSTLLLGCGKTLKFDFDIQGANSIKDLDSLEVHSFDYVEAADSSIAGKLVFFLSGTPKRLGHKIL